MPSFKGLQSNFYTGVVEDRTDPLQVGRVRVRIYGLHTEDKSLIATGDLPWSDVLMPTTASSLSGLGMSPHGLVEGSTVMGFFRDEGDMQDFVVFGSLFGFPSENYLIPNNDGAKPVSRGPDKGFNDARYKDYNTFKTSIDGVKNSSTGRNFQLSHHLDDAPRKPSKLTQNLDGSGTKIENPKTGVAYPKEEYTKLKKSDVNIGAGGTKDYYPNEMIEQHKGGTVKEPVRKGNINPQYPFNKILESESGHVLELDDTQGSERLHMYHRSGTRLEVLPDGSQTMKIVNDSYEIILKDKKILIGGSADIELSNGDYNLITNKGESKDGGNVFITCDSDINLTAKGAIKLKGKVSINGTKYDK